MFGFDLQLRLAVFADPVMLAFDEGVVMDSFSIIGSTHIALHRWVRDKGPVTAQQIQKKSKTRSHAADDTQAAHSLGALIPACFHP